MKEFHRNCDFCGKAGLHLRTTVQQRDGFRYAVTCRRCSARGPLSDNQAGALNLWNGRAFPDCGDEESFRLFKYRFENFMREVVAEGIRVDQYAMFVWVEGERPQSFRNLSMDKFYRRLAE